MKVKGEYLGKRRGTIKNEKVEKGKGGVQCQIRISIMMCGNVTVCIGYISLAVIKYYGQSYLRKSLLWPSVSRIHNSNEGIAADCCRRKLRDHIFNHKYEVESGMEVE